VDWHLAIATATAEFSGLLLGPADHLNAAGFGIGTRDDLRIARVLAGVPTLDVEIDDRTFPQEVGFDRLGGVSYSKGCYVGQETVARIHFRGHPNWVMTGIRAQPGFAEADHRLRDGKPGAYLKTMVRLEDGSGIGLAKVRREIEVGETVAAGGPPVTVTELPQLP
jgi:aminomethyltransferase